MDLRGYISILRKSRLIIVLFFTVAVASAFTYSLLQKPTYQATAKVVVSIQSSGTAVDLVQGNTFSVQRVKTYSDLALTPIVLQPVIEKLALNAIPEDLAKSITVSSPLNTSIISIMVLDSQASAAADIANAISKSLERVVQTLETPNGAQSASPVKITLAQTATTPLTPVSPNIFLNLVIGAVLGIGFGIGGALLRETLNIRIRNERDVSLITPVAILGGIAFDEKAVSRPLVVHIDPTSPLAESFRTLRTNLQFLDVGRVDRSFVITSSNQAEGKSTIAANLAIAMADSGARVLLVDGDLRRSKVAEYMGLEGAVGLTDVLIGRVALMDAIQLWGRKQLYVLPAGHIPPNPSELLGSTVMRKLISELDSLFDVVLYDAPPLLPVTDAAILSKGVGGVVMVVAAGHTHKNDLRNSITALANVGITISGIVLTMTPTKGPDAYRYGHHAYGYFPTTAIGNQI